MAPRAVIFGCEGPKLSAAEAVFFKAADPWGFILFARNCETPDQIRALTRDLRDAVGRDAPVLVDQEGGRVQRIGPPIWDGWDDARDFVARCPTPNRPHAMRIRYQLIGAELAALGLDVNCAPMLDLIRPQTHPRIAERCYSTDPAEVAALGLATAQGLMDAGVLPVIKHMPGHGRSAQDSHVHLPRVTADRATLEASDFVPFRALANQPMAMTSHIVFEALDPDLPVTLSARAIADLRGALGFDGLLISDDLNMQALSGPLADRAAGALAAGCDVALQCNGNAREMAQVVEAVAPLAGRSLARAERALAARRMAHVDSATARLELDRLMTGAAIDA